MNEWMNIYIYIYIKWRKTKTFWGTVHGILITAFGMEVSFRIVLEKQTFISERKILGNHEINQSYLVKGKRPMPAVSVGLIHAVLGVGLAGGLGRGGDGPNRTPWGSGPTPSLQSPAHAHWKENCNKLKCILWREHLGPSTICNNQE